MSPNNAAHELALRCDLFRQVGTSEVELSSVEYQFEVDDSTQRVPRRIRAPWSSNFPIPHPSAYHCYLDYVNVGQLSSTEVRAQVTSAVEYPVTLRFEDNSIPTSMTTVHHPSGGGLPAPQPDLSFIAHFVADEMSGPSAYLRLERLEPTAGGEENIKALRASVRVANLGDVESRERAALVYLEVSEGPGYYSAEPVQSHPLGDTPWLAPGGASEISGAFILRGPSLAPGQRMHSNSWDWVELRAYLRDADGNEVGEILGPFCFRVTDARFTAMAECAELRRRY